MPTCPDGHDSVSSDFCDVCGIRIGPPAVPVSGIATGSTVPAAGTGADPGAGAAAPGASGADACPRCGSPKTGRFCEGCGLDFSSAAAAGPWPDPAAAPDPASGPDQAGRTGQASAPGPGGSPSGFGEGPATGPVAPAWTALVTSDRAYYDKVIAEGGPDAAQTDFPAYCPERRFTLSGSELRIGRRSASRGIEPEIDLTGPPIDTGISRLHAILTSEPDGTWSVVDPGSANGTLVNGADVPEGERIPLHDGDKINLGAWTLITIIAP